VRHPLGKPVPWQDGACKKRGELGRSPSHSSIIPAQPDIGAAFGRPSVFLGFSYPLRLAATRTALIRLSHHPASGRYRMLGISCNPKGPTRRQPPHKPT
jgi:hypothetical protein